MLTKEEYKKEYIRMMDSLRKDHKGESTCNGVHCAECPFRDNACATNEGAKYYVFEAIEIVEKWSKENPDEINIGDEVIYNKGKKGIVLRIGKTLECLYVLIDAEGSIIIRDKDELTKTGRHFSQLIEIFEQLR